MPPNRFDTPTASSMPSLIARRHRPSAISDVCCVIVVVVMTIGAGHPAHKPDRGGTMAPSTDDGFELYDLKVEVTAPPGATIYCCARAGDYFELKGEMLHLPTGQGLSVHSMADLL